MLVKIIPIEQASNYRHLNRCNLRLLHQNYLASPSSKYICEYMSQRSWNAIFLLYFHVFICYVLFHQFYEKVKFQLFRAAGQSQWSLVWMILAPSDCAKSDLLHVKIWWASGHRHVVCKFITCYRSLVATYCFNAVSFEKTCDLVSLSLSLYLLWLSGTWNLTNVNVYFPILFVILGGLMSLEFASLLVIRALQIFIGGSRVSWLPGYVSGWVLWPNTNIVY